MKIVSTTIKTHIIDAFIDKIFYSIYNRMSIAIGSVHVWKDPDMIAIYLAYPDMNTDIKIHIFAKDIFVNFMDHSAVNSSTTSKKYFPVEFESIYAYTEELLRLYSMIIQLHDDITSMYSMPKNTIRDIIRETDRIFPLGTIELDDYKISYNTTFWRQSKDDDDVDPDEFMMGSFDPESEGDQW
jgi:hypothetical protein